MIDFDKIPKNTYDEMVKLFGKEEAEDYIKKVNYNFSTINYAINVAYLKRFFRKYKIAIIILMVTFIFYVIKELIMLFN